MGVRPILGWIFLGAFLAGGTQCRQQEPSLSMV
jgi:hypothetical protein